MACGAVHTGVGVAGISDGYLTQRRLVADGTATVEPRARYGEDNVAGAAILTAGSWAGATGVQVLAVFPNVTLGATAERKRKYATFNMISHNYLHGNITFNIAPQHRYSYD